MSHERLTYRLSPPSPAAFVRLRADCGWGNVSRDVAVRALAGSIVDVTCYDGDTLVGMGRVIGDGALYFYVQDVVVLPAYRGRSIGRGIVARLLDEVHNRAEAGATIGLMSAQGKEDFYAAFGFEVRPSDRLGAGMTMLTARKKA